MKENVKNAYYLAVINVILKAKIKFVMNVVQDIILKITHVLNVNGYFNALQKYLNHTIQAGFMRQDDFNQIVFVENNKEKQAAGINETNV